jgi:hypothetical protein
MSVRSPSLVTLVALAGLSSIATAQQRRVPSPAAARRAAEQLTPTAIRDRIAVISDDSLRGRMTPSPELDKVAAYIAAEFRRLGLQPAGDSGGYIQRYPIRCTRPDTASFVELSSGTTSARWHVGRDAATLSGQVRDGDASGSTVLFAGMPTDTADLFGGIELQNVTVLAVIPAEGLRRGNLILPHVMRALQRGAATWIIVTDPPAQVFASMARGGTQPSCRAGEATGIAGLTILGVRDSSAMDVLRAAGEDVTGLLATTTMVVRALPGLTASLHGTSQVTRETSAPNVIGVLPGSDPALRDEHVVVMAHMDHLGVGRPVDGDSIFNGADDNASGTAGVLEIAQAFTRLDARPRRSMIFLAVSGEEEGLWGSGWYVAHPAAPLAQTVADLDMDMISRGWRDSVSVIGLDFSTLGETVRRVGRENAALVAQPVVDHWPEQNFLYRSDHINFALRGVPILYFLDGTHPDYHRVTDSVDRIDAEAAARIARLAFLTALDVADATARPEWDAASRQRLVTPGP